MNVKNSIRLLEYSSLIAITGFILMVLACMGGTQIGGNINLFVFVLSVVIILISIFRNSIIRYQLEHSQHKNLFYYIIDRIQLDDKFNMAGKQMERVKLNYQNFSTYDFIRDNSLRTQIGSKKSRAWKVIAIYTIFLAAMLFISKRFFLNMDTSTMLVILGAIAIGYYFLFNDANGQPLKEQPLISFDPDSLHIFNKKISWNHLIDWQYNAGGKTTSSNVTLYYQNAQLDIKTMNIELKTLNISKIDLVLLLTVFKEKYGQSVY